MLFVPSDGFLTTALEAEPGLLEYGFARDVVMATPSTLLELLRTVAYSWRQERLARDADQVLEVGRRLHARLSTLSGHLTRLGSALSSTLTRYNETVGSYERSVLTAARRFDDLGVAESSVPEPQEVEATVRTLRPAEAPAIPEPFRAPESSRAPESFRAVPPFAPTDRERDGTSG